MICLATSNSVCSEISTTPVGLVTLISVKNFPIMSNPTKFSSLLTKYSLTLSTIFLSLSDNFFTIPFPPFARFALKSEEDEL